MGLRVLNKMKALTIVAVVLAFVAAANAYCFVGLVDDNDQFRGITLTNGQSHKFEDKCENCNRNGQYVYCCTYGSGYPSGVHDDCMVIKEKCMSVVVLKNDPSKRCPFGH